MIIVVDKDYYICEFNNAAEVAFGVSQQKALGHPVSEFISTEYFEKVFREKRSIINQRVDYDAYHIKTMQNIIYMREQEKALVIMRDITEGVRKQEQLQEGETGHSGYGSECHQQTDDGGSGDRWSSW